MIADDVAEQVIDVLCRNVDIDWTDHGYAEFKASIAERVQSLVVSEREMCAKVADQYAVWQERGMSTGEAIAASIRSRGKP